MRSTQTASVFKLLLIQIGVISMLFGQLKIVDDNMDFELDKKAHLGVSWGLYYTGYTICDSSMVGAIAFSFGIGLGYEIYQGYRHEVHGGFSKEDLTYNVIGIIAANLNHRFWLYIKETF